MAIITSHTITHRECQMGGGGDWGDRVVRIKTKCTHLHAYKLNS